MQLDESNYVCPAEFQDMENMKKLFAGSIPKASTDDEIREYFAKFGEIQELTVMRKVSIFIYHLSPKLNQF